ncbi:MAG: response regulator transcription factor [Flavobacteriales bacterium]
MAQILIVEDDKRVADLIRRGLIEEGFQPEVCYDGAFVNKMLNNRPFDLLITDIILPGVDGLSLCKEIKQKYPDMPVLMLTALGTTDDKLEGFDAGADDYLVKPFEIRELIARIRVLLKRSKTTQTKITQLNYANLVMNLNTKEVFRNGVRIELTPKEFKLLQYMLENTERVLSRTEIAEKVWDTHFDTGTNFIDVYINYLRKKVDKEFDRKLIHTRTGMGFILSDKMS